MMSEQQTEILPWDGPEGSALKRAVDALRSGQPVALPTETVYGLAADATNPRAIARIFASKDRPAFDPLIVHIRNFEHARAFTSPNPAQMSAALALAGAFWPGPFTLILPKKSIIPDLVTSGMPSVALRCSAHPVMHAVLEASGLPLAAPSANRFGRISPTRAKHVAQELAGRIPLIIDDGPSTHGIESTIVRIHADGTASLARPGPVTAEAIGRLVSLVGDQQVRGDAPGQLESHYAPTTPLRIATTTPTPGTGTTGLLCFGEYRHSHDGPFRNLSPNGSLTEAAANLFQMLRELDEAGCDGIVASLVPEKGIGVAVNDRLRRAAAKGGT